MSEHVADLVRRARDGERQAAEALFRRFGAAALRCALGMTGGSKPDAEDLVQDAFVTCLDRLESLREPAKFGGWLLRTVRNQGINRFHAGQSRTRIERLATEPAGGESSPFEAVAGEQRRAAVRSAFDALPDGPLKETARLFYLDEVGDTEDVAHRLGVPKSTVTTRLDRFRTALRKELLIQIAQRTRPGAQRDPEALS